MENYKGNLLVTGNNLKNRRTTLLLVQYKRNFTIP